MLISDWSSDVCSSDLRKEVCGGNNFGCLQRLWRYGCRVVLVPVLAAADTFCGVSRVRRAGLPGASMTAPPAGALEACLALLEKATEGEWEVVQGDEWTTDIGTPEGEYEDGRKRDGKDARRHRRGDEGEEKRHMHATSG